MRPKVMLIIPEMSTGGAQRSLAKLSIELSRHAEIFFVLFNNSAPVAYTIAGQLSSLEVYTGKGWINKAVAFRQRVKKLRELKKRLRIDVSISFLEGADYVNLLSKQKEKVILSIRGSKVHDEIMQGYLFNLRSKILIPWLYKMADVIVAVNQGIAEELSNFYRLPADRIKIINNFYDFDQIHSLSAEAKEGYLEGVYQLPLLITTGRLAPEKRLSFLIKVFIALKKIRSDVRLMIVGDGPELNSLLELCHHANLKICQGDSTGAASDVIFMGNQQNVFKYLSGSSLYLLNSSSEGFPNGMIEAMICGVPVISADCPYGPREILAPELTGPTVDKPYVSSTGVLMPLSNTESDINHWVHCMSSILQNKEYSNKLVQGGLARVSDFNKEKIIDQWLHILEVSK